MDNTEVIQRATQFVFEAREQIQTLDQSPQFIRNTVHAQTARRTAVAGIELVGELVKRVRTEMTTGGDHGNSE